ncbi:PP2C family protein-serine/threonine phosphatase [Streptomyces sp. NPDC058231]|uniref:PP2C family protein-serine/threonine phosphatase n=1 Tax=Streptomyces sp. NPDC058231 TaxID=3346392 RepID=UPI0036DFE5DF
MSRRHAAAESGPGHRTPGRGARHASTAFPSPYTQVLSDLDTRLIDPIAAPAAWLTHDIERASALARAGAHSVIITPLAVHGMALGIVCFYRDERHPARFDEEDVALAEELAARTSIAIENARRFIREHNTAITLQRSLLPKMLPEVSAINFGRFYLPGKSDAYWFDVTPLSSARVGLVIGQVPDHGLQASVTMGRFRTAVSTLADLDLPPDELLVHLDDVATRVASDHTGGSHVHHPSRPACTPCTTPSRVNSAWRAPDGRSRC